MAAVMRPVGRKLACGAFVAGLCVLLAGQSVRSADEATKGSNVNEVKDAPRTAVVHVHPAKLTAKDVLTDGPTGKRIEITGETTLVWVDLHPDGRYAHDTEYVLIGPRGSRVIKGQWWPVLNGTDILRGEKPAAVPFPITVSEK